jgi:23S rRNA pseudouridine2605 synthase
MGKWEELDQKAVDTLSRSVDLEPVDIPAKTPSEQKAHNRKLGKQGAPARRKSGTPRWQVSGAQNEKPGSERKTASKKR